MTRAVHATAWVLLAITAFVLWPERWGGSMTYVITTGDSMAPTWEAGDLAVLRAADDYAVGDVAAFRSKELGVVVMHRILEEDSGLYRFQGDNNDFVDPDLVTGEDLLGRLVLRVPKVGQFFAWFTEPLNLGIAAAALLLLFSDRRPRTPAPAASTSSGSPTPPVVVDVRAMHLPAQAVVADVVAPSDLQQLAERYERPVLRETSTGLLYVTEGGTVYRCSEVVVQPDTRGTGRDWQYGVPADAIPRPRRACSQPARSDLRRVG